MEASFYSPSYKRAGKNKVTKWLRDVILAVHEFEEEEYRQKHDNDLLVIPDKLKGNMAKVRNFILDNCQSEVCVMIDDDVQYIGCYEKQRLIRHNQHSLKRKVAEWTQQAVDLGTVLFGVNLQTDPKFYRQYSPISFHSPILGPFCGIIRNGIRYDERLSFNEDYDYFLQVIKEYHKVLRWNKYHYMAGHLTDSGGCGSYRLLDNEKEQAEIMQKKWGKRVVRYNLKRSTNPRLFVPLKGI